MRVLIACEFSGIVRDAFINKGHDSVSCDLLPTESPGPHIRTDVCSILDDGWDMMIAFPPCTHLATSGARWFKYKQVEQSAAIDFFLTLVTAPIDRIAIENPVGIMSTYYRKPDQIVHPYHFGHNITKRTCLWLKNLPPLIPTNTVEPGPYYISPSGKRIDKQYSDTPKKDRGKLRSITLPGLATAMADQWG